MMQNFLRMLAQAGYAERLSRIDEKGEVHPSTVLADNWNRLFEIFVVGEKVEIKVSGGNQGKFPRLEGIFGFDLFSGATNASWEEISELRKILETKSFPVSA